MALTIYAVGKAGRRPEAQLARAYLDRLPFGADIHEVEERKPLSVAERKHREGEKILAALPANAFLILLDEQGPDLTSLGFAQKLEGWRQQGRPLAFAIGGADGHGEAMRARADALLSLSKMTWPHMLVRVMLAEQIYRAVSISAGHPYHRE
ncbi:ribosomal RNA large subunit methyltransferase H [Iodidimonas nitroreducens]|uniref:Ribosomal RNA large subunit methyltransferase H n=1 Tax=Iodidimonas nitroreducens TaxID=1236968 RepID=A0A5A7N3W8_9PROT|nr:23S rRNA (pseudouridine(1915)-N(3))-methyltransferase RlmH [Iodidimonas nitroreducens]GAK34868.1 ribosomal RNA large subunit methyltransferase H [alpha proteobacterium Q-1]GER02395.1 ribosomal RNA large subunit methyltransferase H [Iodidimonas nitroreducens]